MSNVIQFLEALGKDPSLARFSPDAYAAMVASLDADDSQRQALLDRDHAALSDALGGRRLMFCMVATPDQSPMREPEEPGDDDGDEKDPSDKPGNVD